MAADDYYVAWESFWCAVLAASAHYSGAMDAEPFSLARRLPRTEAPFVASVAEVRPGACCCSAFFLRLTVPLLVANPF